MTCGAFRKPGVPGVPCCSGLPLGVAAQWMTTRWMGRKAAGTAALLLEDVASMAGCSRVRAMAAFKSVYLGFKGDLGLAKRPALPPFVRILDP